jgi:hypothetical protein
VNNKLLEEQVIPGGYLRFLFTTMRVEKSLPVLFKKKQLPLYKGFILKITNKWWPLTTLNR